MSFSAAESGVGVHVFISLYGFAWLAMARHDFMFAAYIRTSAHTYQNTLRFIPLPLFTLLVSQRVTFS